jgi:uncharacterized SAM-binding protein YcdF (DUF218 family)
VNDAFWRILVRALGRPLERRDRIEPADAIVVLGSPVRADGSLTDVVDERVRAGVELWRQGVAPRLGLTGGRGRGIVASISEAEAMARRARELGVPAAALVLEDASRNTSTNARNIQQLLEQSGLNRVVVVTQPFHSRRSVLWFRRVGLDARAYWIADSVQFRHPRRGLRWVLKEYGSLLRDLAITREPGE